MTTIKTLSKELGISEKEATQRAITLGIERLLYTEPKIYEYRINKLLPDNIKVACTIGQGNGFLLELVIRIDKDDNECVYRTMCHLMSGYEKCDDVVDEVIELYNKKRHSRTPLLDLHDGNWSCHGCEYYGEHNICYKDSYGVGNHPDFPCVLHEIKSSIINKH